jgi:magnesium/cobalt transport protein CorA
VLKNISNYKFGGSTVSGEYYTVTITSNAHGFDVGDKITVAAVTNTGSNGTFYIESVTANTFTYLYYGSGTAVSSMSDTGTITNLTNQTITDADAAGVLETIATEEDTNGRIRRNVMDTRRALSFLMRSKLLSDEQQEEARQILRDIDSLENHTAFLFDKINFLMDATVGFINLNQSKIIKIFSVVSVALMPPTLLASIWGMNYKHMPELDSTWGYPMAIGAMVVSALIPLFYFHSKGWMK